MTRTTSGWHRAELDEPSRDDACVPIHVYPTAEREQHVTDDYPQRVCWCPYRVEIVNGSALVIHERRYN